MLNGWINRVADAPVSHRWTIETTDRVDLIQHDWTTLVKTGRSTPFQTQAWLGPWYRIVAPYFNATPLFVVVRNASGAPQMLLPLCLRRHGILRIIEFADCGLSDYNAPLLSHDFAPSAGEMRDLWREILRVLPTADLVRLEKVPAAFAGGPNPLQAISDARPMSINYWRVALPRTRKEYESRLTSTFAKELRRKNRRVEGRGKAALVHAKTPEDALRIFDALAAMRAHRFEELGRDNVLGVPELRSFYEAVITENWTEGFASLSALDVDGTIAAALFALRHDNAYYLLLSSFRDGEWKSASPGNVILDRMTTHLIESGVGVFDYTIGNESYKRDFGAEPQALLAADCARSVLGWPFAMRRVLSHHVGRRLRSPAATRAHSLAKQLLKIS
ncbi:MAG: GNAT family N-acetyltransferase [Alphaproteobacteria bacterium]|nr:GNAT family N-acetyltransferase [Alphaproteobacteria bacterium]